MATYERGSEQVGFFRESSAQLKNLLAILVGLGLAFQVGHFAEHAVQFAVWVSGKYEWVISHFCGRDTPFMSPPVTEMVGLVGAYLFPESDLARQMMVGMECLHLFGNSIFLVTIAGVFYFIPSKWVRYAFYIEGAHLCEHISLTLSAYYLGTPIGVSTLFGRATALLGKEAAVGWRVSWHFFMNLLPIPFVGFAMMQPWSALKNARASLLHGVSGKHRPHLNGQ